MVSPSQKLYCDLCVVVFLLFFHTLDVVGLLVNKFVIVVGVAFVYRFNVKLWYSVSIFVTI